MEATLNLVIEEIVGDPMRRDAEVVEDVGGDL